MPVTLSEEEQAETRSVIADLPRAVLDASAAVVDCDDVREMDIVTVTVTLRHANLASDDAPVPPVHAPRIPFPVKEEWWLFLVDEKARGGSKRIVSPAFVKVAPAAAVETYKLQFQAPARAGVYAYKLHALCTGYVGLDVSADVRITVLERLKGPVARDPDAGDDAEEDEGEGEADMTLENLIGGANREAADYDSDLDDGKAAAAGKAAADADADAGGAGAAASPGGASPARKGGKRGSAKPGKADKQQRTPLVDAAAEAAAAVASNELLAAEAESATIAAAAAATSPDAASGGSAQRRKGKGGGSASKA